jgi:LAO/AO transport system kinase
LSTYPTVEELSQRILAGNVRALARGATLVEAQAAAGRKLLMELFPHTGNAKIIGITGSPGAGKSTLVDQLTKSFRARGRTVGILAVDPSSPFSQGAILGDRIRMQQHHADPGVFVRSMAARGKLGGIAAATLDMALLLDAAGREFVLIETVGVGQGEIEIAKLADLTVLVLVPNMGDDVQSLKAGIMEIADLFVINKADLPGAARLEQEIRGMQGLGEKSERQEATPVRQVSASTGQGIEDLLHVIEQLFENRMNRSDRARVWTLRLRDMLRDRLAEIIPEQEIEDRARRVAEMMEDPYSAVDSILASVLKERETVGPRP